MTAFASPKPQHVAYIAGKLKIPPFIGFSQLYVLRLIQILREALNEAINFAVGRGIKSKIKIIMLLPISLLIHTINLSTYIAEALYIKYPPRDRTWTDRVRMYVVNLLVISYIIITLVVVAIK